MRVHCGVKVPFVVSPEYRPCHKHDGRCITEKELHSLLQLQRRFYMEQIDNLIANLRAQKKTYNANTVAKWLFALGIGMGLFLAGIYFGQL